MTANDKKKNRDLRENKREGKNGGDREMRRKAEMGRMRKRRKMEREC